VLTSPDDLDAVMDWADPLRPKKRNLIEIAKVWKSGRPCLSRIATRSIAEQKLRISHPIPSASRHDHRPSRLGPDCGRVMSLLNVDQLLRNSGFSLAAGSTA